MTLTLDDPTARVNTLNDLFVRSFATVLDRLEHEQDTLSGIILTSAKASFLAGGDLKRLMAIDPLGRAAFVADANVRKSRMRRLERLGLPVVAVLDGPALGGGLELALACHHRIAVDSPRLVVGLPEITLGLLPGGGGVARLAWLIGLDRAARLILGGSRLGAAAAKDQGIVGELAPTAADALARARSWIRANPDPAQPWDREHATVRGEVDLSGPAGSTGSPAGRSIVRLLTDLPRTPFDATAAAESDALADLVVDAGTKAAVQVLFFDTSRIRSRLRSGAARGPLRTPVLAVGDDQTRRLLRGRALPVEVLDRSDDASAGRLRELAGAPGYVVLDVRQIDDAGDSPPARTCSVPVWLHADRIAPDDLVLEYPDAGGELDDVALALTRAGVLPIAVTPGRGSFAALHRAGDAGLARLALRHDEDFAVAAARLGGAPPWAVTGVPETTDERPSDARIR